jgi:hypothetical protein
MKKYNEKADLEISNLKIANNVEFEHEISTRIFENGHGKYTFLLSRNSIRDLASHLKEGETLQFFLNYGPNHDGPGSIYWDGQFGQCIRIGSSDGSIDDFAKTLQTKLNEKDKNMKKVKVYIASPYTLGDVAVNVKVQLDMVDQLMNLGFAPFAPLYSHFQHMAHPRPYTDWIEIDLVWVEACDCVLRLPGKSSGADGEVKHANGLGIPVFYSVTDMVKHYENKLEPAK